MHTGHIWAENLPTGEMRFIFTLPLRAPAHGAAARQMQADRL